MYMVLELQVTGDVEALRLLEADIISLWYDIDFKPAEQRLCCVAAFITQD